MKAASQHLLVRGLDKSVVSRLRSRAQAHRRSLEAELRSILENAAYQTNMLDAKTLAMRIQKMLKGRVHSNSTALLREERDR